jgi:hypothetical protein
MLGNSWVATKRLAASQDGLSSMELVNLWSNVILRAAVIVNVV